MAGILKVTAQWSGFAGAPGYSNFYWRDDAPEASWDQGAIAAAGHVTQFFTAVKGLFPPTVKVQVQSDVPILDEASGNLLNVMSAGVQNVQTGTSIATNYSPSSGAVVTWRSAGVRNGRRVRGRTFLVPLAAGAYTTDGVMAPTPLSTIQTAATAMINAGTGRHLLVWARPTAPGATDGVAHNALNATIPTKIAVLRSRRD